MIVYFNDKFTPETETAELPVSNQLFMPKDKVRISPDDRGFTFGDGIYEVLTITSDVAITLDTTFTAESGLQYKFIGVFTPGASIPDANKRIYYYDSFTVSIESAATTPTTTKSPADTSLSACALIIFSAIVFPIFIYQLPPV